MAAILGDPIPISQSSSTVQPRTALCPTHTGYGRIFRTRLTPNRWRNTPTPHTHSRGDYDGAGPTISCRITGPPSTQRKWTPWTERRRQNCGACHAAYLTDRETDRRRLPAGAAQPHSPTTPARIASEYDGNEYGGLPVKEAGFDCVPTIFLVEICDAACSIITSGCRWGEISRAGQGCRLRRWRWDRCRQRLLRRRLRWNRSGRDVRRRLRCRRCRRSRRW